MRHWPRRFFNEAKRLGVSRDRDLCHFALRLALNPSDALGDRCLITRGGLLADHPVLLRGARLVSLLRERPRDQKTATQRSKERP